MAETKETLFARFGQPESCNPSSLTFFAHSYQEDCALMGGLRNRADERIEWKTDNGYVVAYMKDNKLVKLFN